MQLRIRKIRSRRRNRLMLLVSIGILVASGCLDNCLSAEESVSNLGGKTIRAETTKERLTRIIREYDAQGIHRTGSDGDQASARWLASEVRRAGFEPVLEPFDINRVDPLKAYVEIDQQRIEGIPLIDSDQFTDEAGIDGQLGPLGSAATVGYGRLPPGAALLPAFRELRTNSSHSAILVATGGGTFDLTREENRKVKFPPGYALLNAESFGNPYGKPVLQLPSQAYQSLVQADERDTSVRVVVQVARTDVVVYNVTATVAGSNPKLAPIVVMTPRSGWWSCASERGGGIAVWLELLHVLREHPPVRTVHFVASTGHELGHMGLDHYRARRVGLEKTAYLWLHLGANLAARGDRLVVLQASNKALRDMAFRAMQAEGIVPNAEVPPEKRPLGEARVVYDKGGRYLSLLGDNGFFHSPEDRWPEAVDMDKVFKLSTAFASVIQKISQEASSFTP